VETVEYIDGASRLFWDHRQIAASSTVEIVWDYHDAHIFLGHPSDSCTKSRAAAGVRALQVKTCRNFHFLARF
jgi:hypothetical protein